MRSTSFVFLSVLLHVAVVLAIALHPTQIVSDLANNIEVNMGAAAEKPGAPDAPESTEPSKPQEIAKPAAPVAKVEKKSKPATPKAVPIAAPTMSEENVEAEVAKEIETAPEANEAAKEEPTVTPVAKVSAPPEKAPAPPAPVTEPAATTETASATETAPPAASTAPIGVVTTATGTSTKEQETGELSKGGDSKEGAVAVADLKQIAGNKPPKYPMRARLEGRQGETELVYRVTADGKVADVSIDKSSGSKDLDAEAVKAISSYRFVPGQEGWARHPVAFSLKGIATSTPARLRTKSGAQANVD